MLATVLELCHRIFLEHQSCAAVQYFYFIFNFFVCLVCLFFLLKSYFKFFRHLLFVFMGNLAFTAETDGGFEA